MKIKRIMIVLGILFFALDSASAETIYLKSGQSVEGKIIRETDKSISIDMDGIGLTFYREEIESISGKEPSGAPKEAAVPAGPSAPLPVPPSVAQKASSADIDPQDFQVYKNQKFPFD